MKVFVDDWREAPQGWKLVRTITEAIRLLETGEVKIISLDYDIQFFGLSAQFADDNYGTVARYIAVMPKDKLPNRVYLHTANEEGQKEMKGKLSPLVEVVCIHQHRMDFDYRESLLRHESERENM